MFCAVKCLINLLSLFKFWQINYPYKSGKKSGVLGAVTVKGFASWLQFSLQSKGSTFHPLKGAW